MTITTWLTFSIFLFLLWKICRFLYDQRYHWTLQCLRCLRDIPGPPGLFLLGNILQFSGTPEQIWATLCMTVKDYPKIFKIWLGNRCGLFIIDPDDIEILLTSNVNTTKGELYVFLAYWLRNGLLLSKGDQWKVRRKMLTPAFHFNILKQFVPVFERYSEQTVTNLKLECNKDYTEVIPVAVEHALLSVSETTMGVQIDGKNSQSIKYKKAIHSFGGMVVERLLHPWLWCDWIMFRLDFGKNLRQVVQTLHHFSTEIIQNRLNTWDPTTNLSVESASGKKKLPMLDILIGRMKETGEIDYTGICEEVDTFMFEGHDTTSMALSFFLMLLANHPEIQLKILEEQQLILGNSSTPATYENLQEMVYLERCIKESLRLYPSVPLIIRKLEQDMEIKNYKLVATMEVYIGIYFVHRNPDIWPNPEKYDPDRFLPENSANRHPFAFIPFSAGPRNCIGQRFAMLEMKSFISKILKEYILEPVDTPDTITLRADLVMRPTKPIKVKFRKRY